jgi:hypothetical protein
VGRAEDRLREAESEVAALEEELKREIDAAGASLDPATLAVEPVEVAPLKKDISIEGCELAWLPHSVSDTGLGQPLWRAPD